MNYPKKGALIRLARATAAAAVAAAVGLLINETPVVLEGTSFAVFVPLATAALLSLDKYIREKRG